MRWKTFLSGADSDYDIVHIHDPDVFDSEDDACRDDDGVDAEDCAAFGNTYYSKVMRLE